MVTDRDRSFAAWLVRVGLWRVRIGMFRVIEVVPRWGTRWILAGMKRRQVTDDLHHAPCCEANHWHRQRLVFRACTCGAATANRRSAPPAGDSLKVVGEKPL